MIAFVAPTCTPYFDHLFRRVTNELRTPVTTFYTHARDRSGPFASWRPSEQYASVQVEGTVAADWDRSIAAQLREWRAGRAITRHLRALKPRAVILLGYRDASRWHVMWWCRRHRVPAFAWSDVNARGASRDGRKEWIKRAYVHWIDRQLSGWLICGSAGREYLSHYGISDSRMFVSPCEPDYQMVAGVTAEDVQTVLSDLGLGEGRRRLICSGRLVPTKRFDSVVQAFASIAEHRPEWDLVIAGDGPLRESLALAVPPSLANRVRFAGHVREPKRLWALYRSCQVLVHLADHEPWGLIVNEAAACGLAVVCSDVVGSAVELVRDGVNGRIVPRGNADAAATALLDVTSESVLDRMRNASTSILARWRERADPIVGIRSALASSQWSPSDDRPADRSSV